VSVVMFPKTSINALWNNLKENGMQKFEWYCWTFELTSVTSKASNEQTRSEDTETIISILILQIPTNHTKGQRQFSRQELWKDLPLFLLCMFLGKREGAQFGEGCI
jgi:hypothetical protein